MLLLCILFSALIVPYFCDKIYLKNTRSTISVIYGLMTLYIYLLLLNAFLYCSQCCQEFSPGVRNRKCANNFVEEHKYSFLDTG